MNKPFLTIEKQINTKALNDAVKSLSKKACYVGIAKGSEGDKRSDGGPDNHLLGFIHENGSPSANIPPRPFLVPGVKSYQEEVIKGLSKAMRLALKDDAKGCNEVLERTALKTADAVKNYMQTADFEPLKPATIANRNRSRLTQGKRQEEIDQDASKIRPLINTGSLRNSIDGFFVEE